MKRYLLIGAAVLGSLVGGESLAVPVTPGGYENIAGASQNCIPFTCRGVTRYQQVYNAVGFGGATGIIDSMAFRLDEQDVFGDGSFLDPFIDNGSFTLQLDLLVTLSHTTADGELVLDQLVDADSDAAVVWDGLITWNAVQLAGNGLNAFDLKIDFADIFAYLGTQNLLVDIEIRNADSIAQQVTQRYLDAAGFPPGSGDAPFGRVWVQPGLTGFNQGYGLVTQFDFLPPVTVPTPGSLPLTLLSGLFLLISYWPLRRTMGAAQPRSFEPQLLRTLRSGTS